MREGTPKVIRLQDYTPPRYLIDTVDLQVELADDWTTVRAELAIRRNPAAAGDGPLVLDGQDLELRAVTLDGAVLPADRYEVGAESLTVPGVPEAFRLGTEVRIRPQDNTALEGLYKSGPMYCTQCEAEGFRRITFFADRPDVMSRYSTTITAERARYPVLLSNGNPVARGEHPDGRHWVRWEDPFRKPCYLFALVAGDLVALEDRFRTRSGREVVLRIFVEPQNRDKCAHAMRSLQQAMRWDEDTYGLEYDLDIYMIVAVDHFNMGAMENKGLNVFNSKYVLARPDTATDSDYLYIQGVIGHEYFHNWTGNRVTCRDWFQLSLKEGLTVFRDREFSSDMHSRALKRVEDVRRLRTAQFAEDAGPMAHPVRPDNYIEINNFYTMTVYEKGAEVIGMMQTLIGREAFKRGITLYLQRHDGEAATVEDFVAAMQEAGGVDLSQFRLWYSQAGTPVLTVRDQYDAAAGTYVLRVAQHCPPTPGQPRKDPLHIPLALGLVGADGADLPLQLEGEAAPAAATTRVLELREAEHTFRFVGVAEHPTPSLLRGFSAPVKLDYPYTDRQSGLLLAHDSDPFCRWEAGQQLATNLLLGLVRALHEGREQPLPHTLEEAAARVLADCAGDPAMAAELLTLPSQAYLAEQMETVDVDGIHTAHLQLRRRLAGSLRELLLATYRACKQQGKYATDPLSMGRRRLKNLCLGYLMELHDPEITRLCLGQFRRADNMTDSIGALAALVNHPGPERGEALDAFYERWQGDPLVLDKWFSLQATSHLPDTLAEVRRLLGHPAFSATNPNRVRALIGAFCHGNPVRFHDVSGDAYSLLAEQVLRLDPVNPQVAARLLGAVSRWRRYDPKRRTLMREQLERIARTPRLSKDTYEVATKSLA